MRRNPGNPQRRTEANELKTQRVIETYHGKLALLNTWEMQDIHVQDRNHAYILEQRAKLRTLKNMIMHRADPNAIV